MKLTYPILIAQSEDGYLVYIPDMDIYTEGGSMADAMEMARDAIGLKGIDMEDEGIQIPQPSDYETALCIAGKDTEEFDYTSGVLTLVDIDFTEYRRKKDNRAVRRNVTLPSWLNAEAEKLHINVSKVLQEALSERIKTAKK